METTTQASKDTKVGAENKTSASTKVYKYFGREVILGSRQVVIKQVSKFSMLPKDPGAKAIRDEVIKKIGSQWKKGSKDIIRGLSTEEEGMYLPGILGTQPKANEWHDKVRTYWADFVIEVPVEGGVELEVGFKAKEGSNDLNNNAEPIKLADYMKYNFAKANSSVAVTDEQLDNMPIYEFFVVDKSKEKMKLLATHKLGKTVNVEYYKLISAAASGDSAANVKMEAIIELKGGQRENGINIESLITQEEKELELEKIKDRDLAAFEKMLKDPNLQSKGIIKKAVTRGIIEIQGNSYYYMDKSIGSTLLEAVSWLENPNNATTKMKLLDQIKSVNF